MNVIKMYRDGAVAEVDTDHAKTYQNFLAHGWTVEAPISAAEPTEGSAPEGPAEEPDTAPKAAAAPKGRKAR